MNRKTALGAAAGLTLTMAGGVSALFLIVGQAAPASTSPAQTTSDAVVTEYVDQYGNAVDPATLAAPAPEVIFVNPDGSAAQAQQPTDTPAAVIENQQPEVEAAYQEPAYEEPAYEEEEDHDDYEDEDHD